jgi:hypothetical protein
MPTQMCVGGKPCEAIPAHKRGNHGNDQGSEKGNVKNKVTDTRFIKSGISPIGYTAPPYVKWDFPYWLQQHPHDFSVPIYIKAIPVSFLFQLVTLSLSSSVPSFLCFHAYRNMCL